MSQSKTGALLRACLERAKQEGGGYPIRLVILDATRRITVWELRGTGNPEVLLDLPNREAYSTPVHVITQDATGKVSQARIDEDPPGLLPWAEA